MSGRTSEAGATLVELLVATTLGLVVVLAGVQLLKTHAALALQVQADLAASSGAVWALRSAARDVRRAGADPRGRGFEAFEDAASAAMKVGADTDGDGFLDPNSEETVGLAWSGRGGGRVVRRVGRQSMGIVSGVPEGGFRLRYYDGDGRELEAAAGLGVEERRRVRRVALEIEVHERRGALTGVASLASSASVRVREGR